jgi:hypothetical protein
MVEFVGAQSANHGHVISPTYYFLANVMKVIQLLAKHPSWSMYGSIS